MRFCSSKVKALLEFICQAEAVYVHGKKGIDTRLLNFTKRTQDAKIRGSLAVESVRSQQASEGVPSIFVSKGDPSKWEKKVFVSCLELGPLQKNIFFARQWKTKGTQKSKTIKRGTNSGEGLVSPQSNSKGTSSKRDASWSEMDQTWWTSASFWAVTFWSRDRSKREVPKLFADLLSHLLSGKGLGRSRDLSSAPGERSSAVPDRSREAQQILFARRGDQALCPA